MNKGPFWELYEHLKAGDIERREFITKALSLGVGLPIILFVLNATTTPPSTAVDAQP